MESNAIVELHIIDIAAKHRVNVIIIAKLNTDIRLREIGHLLRTIPKTIERERKRCCIHNIIGRLDNIKVNGERDIPESAIVGLERYFNIAFQHSVISLMGVRLAPKSRDQERLPEISTFAHNLNMI